MRFEALGQLGKVFWSSLVHCQWSPVTVMTGWISSSSVIEVVIE